MKTMEKTTFTEEQMKGVRQLCGILNEISGDKKSIFLAIANAYMDGMATGVAVAAAGTLK